VADIERRRKVRAELLADTERQRIARAKLLAASERRRSARTIARPIPGNPNPGDTLGISATRPVPGNPNPGDSRRISAARILDGPYSTGRPNAATLERIPGNPNSPPEFPPHPTAGRMMTEEESWDDMERMRSAPQLGWREWQAHKSTQRIGAERETTLKSLYHQITGSTLHDGATGTLLLLELLRELRELKTLALNRRRS
jgi:hypothetical protein